MPAHTTTGASVHVSLSDQTQSANCALKNKTLDYPKYKALPRTGESDDDYKKRAEREYHENSPSKTLEQLYMYHTRSSMYKELRKNFDRNILWAKSLQIDPFAEGFDPTTPAPPELSSWLYLFHAYLQLEEAYAEGLELLNITGRRLIDQCHYPPQPWRSFREEAQQFWSACADLFAAKSGRSGSRALQYKKKKGCAK